jgi:methyl-accepting chemotaxis protein
LVSIDGSEAFAQQFEAYSRSVAEERPLRHAWREFSESLITPREGEPARIRNTHEPGVFFNTATIVDPTVHNRFFDTVPSHLVGLGILGTFLGLAAGVGVASGDLNSQDPTLIRNSLSQLLKGASLAFLTSIFGLGSSLVFLWIERILVGRVHRTLGAWVEKLEACVELVTPESIALEQLEQERRQTKQLERFNDELVFALEKALDEQVAQRLVPELGKVVEAIQALRSDRVDTNVAAMQRLVEEFIRTLTQSTGKEMEQIGATLQGLTDRLRDLLAAMEESQRQGREAMDRAAREMHESLTSGGRAVADDLRNAVSALSQHLGQASDGLVAQVARAGSDMRSAGEATAERIASSLGTFAEGVARLDRLTSAQSGLAQRIEELAVGLRSAGDVVVDAHRGFQGSLESNRAISRDVEHASSRIASALEATSRVVEQVSSAAASIQAEQEKIAAAWQDYESRFRGVDQGLARAFEQIDEGVRRYADRIREFHVELEQHVSKAIQSLSSAVAELSGAIEDLNERLRVARR